LRIGKALVAATAQSFEEKISDKLRQIQVQHQQKNEKGREKDIESAMRMSSDSKKDHVSG
jgi:hypothetical protein